MVLRGPRRPGSGHNVPSMTAIGLLHPGEMGAALGARLRERGHDVLWASDGRSAATRDRATAARLRDAGSPAALADESDIVLSVCPPHAALDIARAVAGARGVFVDANAIAPATVQEVRAVVEDGGGRFVDGGIVGPPPEREGTTRLYLSGARAAQVAEAFAGTPIEAPVLGPEPGAASALKMAYAAWTKGTAAMLLAIRADCSRERRRGRAHGRVVALAARRAGPPRGRRRQRRAQGLAVDRRDGGDRRDVRRGRPARRLPPRRGGRVPLSVSARAALTNLQPRARTLPP